LYWTFYIEFEAVSFKTIGRSHPSLSPPLLSFAYVYFLESGLFNGLSAIKIKKIPLLYPLTSEVVFEPASSASVMPLPPFSPPVWARSASADGIAWISTFAQQMTPDFCLPGFRLGSP
jgi:hypothetical protein